ncbi:hypothetical protein BC936DRAFT_149946 [Jimgerdemannia flammicorona]|uniref:Uncharacterized protein n=1 Tax=Jimgerdemannia flammicorona TaxID=994334 RepID=A0A433DJL8_9FUNG|nr:hypothetical protein BC936DRAFT_149946 [Jimgerdemannia flammicorona]
MSAAICQDFKLHARSHTLHKELKWPRSTGCGESKGAEVKILRVPETLPAEVPALPALSDIAVANVSVLIKADGILLGSTRFGGVPQQSKE